jgi:alkylation response protein AidB-like acyl-CoA dehydrogenase
MPAPDLDTFRQQARRWLAGVGSLALSPAYEERSHQLRDWQRRLYDAGWVGIQWPEAYGGRGLSESHALVFAEELAAARLPMPVGTIGLEVVGPTILRFGTEEQRTRLLPPLLRGDELWCQGFSEPEAGSDIASLRTRARANGDELVISGHKIWTSWATDAQWCAVLARTDPASKRHRGISYLLVDMRSEGVTVAPIVQITGDAEFNEVFLDEVRIPAGNVLGEFGQGWKLALDTLGNERAGFAIRRTVENQTAFIDLVHALRDQGEPDDETAEIVGSLFVTLRTCEAQTRATAQRIAAGQVQTPIDSLDKLALTDSEQHLYAAASELLGAQRMVGGASVHGLAASDWTKDLLYARAASVYGGSSQIQRMIIAERHLGLPRGR